MTDYIIRDATEQDVLDIVLSVKQFCKEVPHPAWDKFDSNKVNGCASQVWLHFSNSDKLYFDGDSDAIIVKGLIALLRKLYNETPIKDIKNIDALENLKKLGLDDHLSAQRSNGLKAMVEKIQSLG